jgi:hypothetical protein
LGDVGFGLGLGLGLGIGFGGIIIVPGPGFGKRIFEPAFIMLWMIPGNKPKVLPLFRLPFIF